MVTGFDAGTVQLWLGNGAGLLVRSVSMSAPGSQPQGVAAGDIDHNGHRDVVVASAVGLQVCFDLGDDAPRADARGPGAAERAPRSAI